MMGKIVEKFGSPLKICSAAKRGIHRDLKAVVKFGKVPKELRQQVGVIQGDSMAPIMFLFFKVVFMEAL